MEKMTSGGSDRILRPTSEDYSLLTREKNLVAIHTLALSASSVVVTNREGATLGNDEIRVVIYGCRGSIPVNGADFDQFGGSTSCILITSDDAATIGIIDAGTGIRRLGKEIMKTRPFGRSPFSSHLPTFIGIIFKDSPSLNPLT